MPLDVEYWTDPLCIWAFVGHAKLERVLDAFGDKVAIRYRTIPVFDDIAERFDTGVWSANGREGRRASNRRIAREHLGLEITGDIWLNRELTSSWMPGMAVRAVALLEGRGQIPTGCVPRFQWAVQRAFFEEDRNMTHRGELLAVAEACAIDVDAIVAELDSGRALAALLREDAEAQALKLRGSPSYVFDGGRSVVYGNFDYAVLEATVRALVTGSEAGGSNC